MASTGYAKPKRKRAPKPLSVPLIGMSVGIALYIIGLMAFGNIDMAALGVLIFVWGLVSTASILLGRRLRARRAARSGL